MFTLCIKKREIVDDFIGRYSRMSLDGFFKTAFLGRGSANWSSWVRDPYTPPVQQIAELFAFLKKWIPPLIQPCTGKTVICEENFLKKLFGEELPTLFRLFINISKDQVLFIVQIYAVPYHILLSLKCV